MQKPRSDVDRGSPSPAARQAARELLRRIRGPGEEGDHAELAGALEPVLENLRGALGDDGCDVLFSRALSRAEGMHPALATIRAASSRGVSAEHLLASIKLHGADTTAAAVEALLAALIDILARLIGENMAIRIIGHEDSRLGGSDGAPSP